MMKKAIQIVSWLSLLTLIMPSILFLAGQLSSLDNVKHLMLAATILWFVSTPLWMWHEDRKSQGE